MLYLRHIPSAPLREFVDCIWHVADTPSHVTERILPCGTTELVVNLRDDEIRIDDPEQRGRCKRFSGAVVSGPYGRSFDVDSTQHASIMGVHFKPGGSFPFLGLPLNELFNAHVNLRQLWGAQADALRAGVCAAKIPADRFAIVEETLASILRRQPKRHDAVGAALDALDTECAPLCVCDIAQRVGLSHRRLIEVFAAEVGMTPKLFSRVRRFQRTLDRVRRAGSPDWARLSLASGYCDQSHLIRDFLAFSGLNPSEYLKRQRSKVKDFHVALAG